MSDRKIQRLITLLTLLIVGDVAMQAYNLYETSIRNRPSSAKVVAPGTTINLKGHSIQGNASQHKILVEFSDFECPFCIKYATTVHKTLESDLVVSGKVRYAFVNHPLPIHPEARMLASAAICAGEQRRFFEMHDELFEREPKTNEDVMALVKKLTLDETIFEDCLGHASTGVQIDADVAVAKKLGLNGTPAFAFGTIDSNDQVTVEQFLMGVQPADVFEAAVSRIKTP